MAVIEEPVVIEKILKHIGLDPRLPPIAPARKRAEFAGCAAWVLRGNGRAERNYAWLTARAVRGYIVICAKDVFKIPIRCDRDSFMGYFLYTPLIVGKTFLLAEPVPQEPFAFEIFTVVDDS